jgi:hypothetical protein
VSRRATRSATTSLALLLLAACPALADVDTLYDEYRLRGLVRGCAHPEAELRDGLAQIPADIRAYDPGFADALNAALEQRAASCEGGAALLPAQPVAPGGGATAADGSPGPAGVPSTPAPATEPSGEGDGGWPQALLLVLSGCAGLAAAGLTVGLPYRRRRTGV